MLKTKHDIWSKNGKQKFVLVPYAEYQSLREQLEDAEDFRSIESSKIRQGGAPTTSLDEMSRLLSLSRKRKRTARAR